MENSYLKWRKYFQRYGHSIAECRQKQQNKSNLPLQNKATISVFLPIHEERPKIIKQKTFKETTVQENHSHLTTVKADHNQQTLTIFVDDHQIDAFNNDFHKSDTVDQTIKISSLEKYSRSISN